MKLFSFNFQEKAYWNVFPVSLQNICRNGFIREFDVRDKFALLPLRVDIFGRDFYENVFVINPAVCRFKK